MKFNFLIKNVTCNFTKYRAPLARSSHRCSVKKVFLKISQISRGNALLESLFNKVAGLKTFWKIFKNTDFEEHQRTAVSASQVFLNDFHQKCGTTIYVVIRKDKRFYAKGYRSHLRSLIVTRSMARSHS